LTLDPDHTALVIVECQNGVVGPASALPGLAEAAAPILPVIGRLARAARKAGVRVVHLTYVPTFDGRSTNQHTPLQQGIRAATSPRSNWRTRASASPSPAKPWPGRPLSTPRA
jgi:nicotinamidase-related amidase